MWFIVLVIASITLQCITTVTPIKLIRITTGRRWAWIMLLTVLILMIVRCLVIFYFTYTGTHSLSLIYLSESIAFLISLFMLLGIIGIAPIISSIKDSEEKLCESKTKIRNLEQIAKFDVVTSLPNRYQFNLVVDQMLAYCVRHNSILAVLSMDIDNFKNVNDTYGHEVGDMLLKEVGARCKAIIRAEDFIARMGGDEFIVIVFGLKDSLEAGKVAEKIMSALKPKCNLGGQELSVTASIGIACYPMDGQDQQTLLKNADIAMYKAKELGRNNYQFHHGIFSS